MNSLFTCSWQKNITPLNEDTWVEIVCNILTEAADEGVPDEQPSKIPGKRGKTAHPKYARMMGMQSVKDLAGTMTPRYFATKVLRQLENDYPGKSIEDISDTDIQSAMNVVANLSRNLNTRPDVQLTTAKASEQPTAQEKIKKGKTGFETLNLNLTPDTEFNFEQDSPLGHGIYTAMKDGLKYRVAVKDSSGQPLRLDQLTPDIVASVVVVEPSKKQVVTLPTIGDLEAPKVIQDKPVADYPAEGSGDFSDPDPEDLAVGKPYEIDEVDDDEEDKDDKEDKDDEEDYEDEEDDKKKPSEEDSESIKKPEKIVVIKKSPQAINAMMKEDRNNKMQSRFKNERRNTLGY